MSTTKSTSPGVLTVAPGGKPLSFWEKQRNAGRIVYYERCKIMALNNPTYRLRYPNEGREYEKSKTWSDLDARLKKKFEVFDKEHDIRIKKLTGEEV